MSMVKVEHVKRMHIELSSKCNASCPGCPRNVRGGYDLPWLDKGEWKLEQFKHFFSPEFLQQIDSIFGLICENLSITPEDPKSGEHEDQTAPRTDVAI